MVGHRYNHAVMIGAASYLRWGDDGTAHAERDDRPGWVRPEGALCWAAAFPRVEDRAVSILELKTLQVE